MSTFKQKLLRLVPHRIWQQVGLVFALAITVVLLVLGIVLIKESRKAVKESVLRDYEEIAHSGAREITNFIEQPQSLLVNTAAMLSTVAQEDIEDQKVLVYQLVTDHPDLFSHVALAGLDGKELVSSNWDKTPEDHSGRQIFRDTLDTQKHGLSKVYFSSEHFPYITISAPIHRLNKLSSVLLAEIKLNSVWDIVQEIQHQEGEAFLVDEEGYVLVHNEEKKVYRGDNLKEFPSVQAALDGKNGSIEEDKSQTKGREHWLSAYAPIAPLGWGLIIRQPVQTAYAFSYRMQRVAFGMIAAAILIAILLSLGIARWIVRPIKNLTEVTSKVAAGDLDQEIKTERDDEIGKLVRSFNEMTRGLKKAKQMEKLSNIGMATSKIAHELRNPLVALKTFIQLLPRRHQDKKFIAQFQETVPPELARLEKMLNTLPSFSVEQKLHLVKYDIISIIRNSLELFGEKMSEHKVNIATSFDPDNVLMLMDSDKIKQVFINLIQNALEAMPQGGKLDIISRVSSNGQPDTVAVDKIMEIKVIDTGKGMNENVMANAFEPFYTSKHEGLGLGLAISKEIVEGHEGSIAIESLQEQGTSFIIKLPIRSA